MKIMIEVDSVAEARRMLDAALNMRTQDTLYKYKCRNKIEAIKNVKKLVDRALESNRCPSITEIKDCIDTFLVER